jgi:hypothetical protein
VLEKDVTKKFVIWTKMVDYILKPIGGRQDVKENNCDCADCKRDLAALMS